MLSAIQPTPPVFPFLPSRSVLTRPRGIRAPSGTPARDSSLPFFWGERDPTGLLKNEVACPTPPQGQTLPRFLVGSPDPQMRQ